MFERADGLFEDADKVAERSERVLELAARLLRQPVLKADLIQATALRGAESSFLPLGNATIIVLATPVSSRHVE